MASWGPLEAVKPWQTSQIQGPVDTEPQGTIRLKWLPARAVAPEV